MQPNRSSLSERALKFLGSLKLSFVLMIALGALVAQRAIIAQRAMTEIEEAPAFLRFLDYLGIGSAEALGLPSLIVLVLFVMNLSFASWLMARKVKAKQKGLRGFRGENAVRAFSNTADMSVAKGAGERLEGFLKDKGFRVNKEQAGEEVRLSAARRSAGHWGVFFFHLTFLLILLGVLLSTLTRSIGYMELSPGGFFIEARENYLVQEGKPMLFGEDKKFGIRLDDIRLSYWKPGEVKQRASVVSVFSPGGEFKGKREVAVNSPFRVGGMKVYQAARHGFIAELEARDSEGTVAPGTARFRIPREPGGKMQSGVILPGTALRLDMELFTERIAEIEGLERMGSIHMATLLKVTTQEDHVRTFRGVVFLGDSLDLDDEITLEFKGLRPYTSFLITQDYGVPVIFAGFVLLLVGLAATYFWVPEHVWAVVRKAGEGEVVVVGAVTERFKESFKERFESMLESFGKEAARP